MATQTLYSRTLSKRKFRLLTILPSGENPQQAVACELHEWFILFAPEYEALSYCWGDPKNQKDIVCNGLTCSVTTSLHNALKRLRLRDKPRVIWADAMCINQLNHEEKSFQVSLMGRIYSAAKRVVVWLGHADRTYALQIEKALEDFREDFRFLDDSDDWALIFAHLEKLGPPSKYHKQWPWDALTALFDEPWFKRVWVVQEIRLASEAILYWGAIQLSWHDIVNFALWILAELRMGRASPAIKPSYALAMDMNFVRPSGSQLLHALALYRRFLAADPRDNVYGMLGLAELEEEKKIIPVDYDMSVDDLYERVARVIMQQTKTTDILAYVSHPQDFDGRTGFKSWIPRWDDGLEALKIWNERDSSQSRFQFHLPRAFFDNICDNNRQLSLSGLLFDTVSRIDKLSSLDTTEIPVHSSSKSEPHPFIRYWRNHVSQDTPLVAHKDPSMLVLAHTLTLGRVTLNNETYWIAKKETCNEFLESFLFCMDSLHNISERVDSNQTLRADQDARGALFRGLIVSAGRVLFETCHGSYGLGPICLREGDLIVQLEGTGTPYALRQRNEGYLLLGQVYIDKIMNGELVKLMEEGKIQKQEFCLV